MKLSRAKAFTSIILTVFCLLFSCQFLIFAQQPETNIPAELQELLQGKFSDFSSAASRLKETELPHALACGELLRFKALHQEIHVSVDQINNFESQVKSRLEKSSVVSFSKTDTCRKKIEATEIEVAGQKLVIPEYYVSETGLTITGVIPAGEAGTIFPDIQLNIFSQSSLTTYSLLIDGNEVPNNKINLFKDSDELSLVFRADLNAENILAIGTHTAEISITNETGDKVDKKWSFTVGVKDIATPPLPEGTKIIKELPIDPEKILPGQKISGQFSVVIYQDKAGKKYTLYKLQTSSGQIITSQNLAFIGRKLIIDRDDPDEVTITPKTHFAFVGNKFDFSYTYVGSGKVLSVRWQIRNGSQESTEASATMAGDLDVACILLIEKSANDADGNPIFYQYEATVNKHIGKIAITTDIYHDRRMIISNEPSSSIPVEGEVWLWLDNTVHEGKKYTLETGELTVDKLRWKTQAAQGSPTIKNPVATMTQILFSEYGYAELVFDVKMTYKESGEIYESNFKPEVSGLYAFYPVSGKAAFSKFPRGQISNSQRHLKLKSFEFTIKKQTRLISSASDFELAEPILICESSIWPASSPIKITRALPVIAKGHSNNFLETVDPFTFVTPLATNEDEIPLSLFGRFFFDQEANLKNPAWINDLESIPVFEPEAVIQLQLSPSEALTIQEGQEAKFEAQLVPVDDFGTGLYSATDKSLNILDGYTISFVENIFWFEEPLWGDEEEDWKKKAVRTLDFMHIFDPIAGVGSYSMNCGFVMNVQESETKDEISTFIVNSTPVNVLPGLRILSPIDKLAYPLNQTINVTTTLDSAEYIDQWQNIKWKLNGKEFKPGVEKPPFKITLDHVGKWKLEAELKTKDSNTNEEIILRDRAEFEVKPLEISISPAKKVFDFNKQQDSEINISVLVNGDEIKKPGEPVPWQDEDSQLVVDSVAWKLVTAPENCADCSFDEQSFKSDCQFTSPGAATAIATITVRIVGAEKLFNKKHKGFKDKFEEQIFEIPAGRADLWAVKLGAITNEEKHFPEKSIAKAYRTYEVKSFEFDFESGTRLKKPHSYNIQDGLTDPISLKPALTGIDPLSASINFKWQVTSEKKIEQNQAEPTKMVIKPTDVCDYKVAAEVALDFGCSALKLGEISVSANAVDLFSLIETKVDPSSFTITLGEAKTLKYIVSSLEQQPSDGNGQSDTGNSSGSAIAKDESKTIYLLDKSYALTISKVGWLYNSDSSTLPTPVKNSIESNPYDFSSNVPGKIKGQANGELKVEELKSLKTADFDAIANFSGYVSSKPIQILINGKPLGSESYHMGQKVVLSYKVEPDNLENVSWSLEGPLPVKSIMNRARVDLATHTVNNFEVEFLAGESLKEKQIEFYLFDFDSEKIVKNGSFTYKIADTEYVKNFEIHYSRPYLKNIDINPLEEGQRIDVKEKTVDSQSLYIFGFINESKPGILAKGEFENKTDVAYRVGSFQLIKIDGTRPFNKIEDEIASNPKIIIQVKKTINASAPISMEPKYWLDTSAPQDDPFQTTLLAPGNIKTIELANDIPSIGLLDQLKHNSSTYNAKHCHIGQDFLVYVYAKPIYENGENIFEYYKSIWFPIAVYKWSWSGLATYYSALYEWDTNPFVNPIYNLEKVKLEEFPSWSDFTQTGSSKPEWRDYIYLNE